MQTGKVWTLDEVKADWARVKCEVAYVRTIVAAHILLGTLRRQEQIKRLAAEQHKYSPDQPRVSAGQSGGGQWTDGGGGANSGGGAVDVLDASNGTDLLTLVLDPGSGGNGGGARPNGCAAAFAACTGYAERLYDLGYERESFELRQSCFVHTNTCITLGASVQSSDPSRFGLSLFPPDFEKGGGGVVLHMYGQNPVYNPPATDPLANIPPAR